jgi:predicted cupin superfamily sugar epimerase
MKVLLILFLSWGFAQPSLGENMVTAQDMIKKLDLKPLPGEGGYYRETYRSEVSCAVLLDLASAPVNRNVSTAIYYLVTPDSFSTLHRVKSDEIFHFYSGDPVEMIQIDDAGNVTRQVLGSDILKGEQPQVVVPKGVWQGTRLITSGKWALMGTTVAPGFEFEDFELGERQQMVKLFPQHREYIMKFTREPSQAVD